MTKDENLITRLAFITDYIEKLNIDSTSINISFDVNEEEYDELFVYFQNKYNRITQKPKRDFSIRIGEVEIVFNKNNV